MQLPDQHDGQGDDEDGEYPDPADAQQELPVRGLPGLLRGGFFRGLLLFGQPLLLLRLPLELGLPGRFRGGFLRGLLLFGELRLFFRLGFASSSARRAASASFSACSCASRACSST